MAACIRRSIFAKDMFRTGLGASHSDAGSMYFQALLMAVAYTSKLSKSFFHIGRSDAIFVTIASCSWNHVLLQA